MTLSDLIGEHKLSGVELGTGPKSDDDYTAPNTVTFVLDGQAYRVTEDPGDGYRSSMGDIEVCDAAEVSNRFAPVNVVARYRNQDEDRNLVDILEIIDASNGEIILEVGTDNCDDYYPSFVGSWWPKRMACNQGRL